MRAVGYSAEAAVADIIDNRLSAEATAIQVKYDAADVPLVAIAGAKSKTRVAAEPAAV